MSKTSKFNPKRLAIKKKWHCRLGLTKKRHVPPPHTVISSGNQNAEWSVTVSALPPSNRSKNMGEEIIFNMFKTLNPVLHQCNRESTLNLRPKPPEQKLRSGNNRIRFEQIDDYLSSRIGHSPARSTVSQYVGNLYSFYGYLDKKAKPPPFLGEVDEGGL